MFLDNSIGPKKIVPVVTKIGIINYNDVSQ